MTHSNPFDRFLTTACLAASLALAGCGATPNGVGHLVTSAKKTTVTTAVPSAKATPEKPATPLVTPRTLPAAPLVATQPVAQTAVITADAAIDTTLAPATGSTPISIESTGGASGTSGPDAAAGSASAIANSPLSAEISTQKNGVLFGMGAYKCSVTVTNTSDTAQTGVLKLTFMNGSKISATAPQVSLVTIPAHGTQSFDFKDPKWSTDSAVVSVAPTAAGQPMAAFVTATKNGVFLGAGTYKCTVEVINPDDVVHTGNLVVTFLHGTTNSKTPPVTTAVTLQPHTSQSYDFSDPKWSTNHVTAVIQ